MFDFSNSGISVHKKVLLVIFLLLVWLLFYLNLDTAVNFFVYQVLQMPFDVRITNTLWFFLYEVPKVLLLLTLIVFFVGIIRSYFSAERTQKLLGGKRLLAGNISASLLGIVTPFCSCSAIPLFLGFIESGVPLGVTFSFLIAAPMINEVAVVLLFGLFGWKTAALYVSTGLFIAIISGYIIGRLKLERYVAEWVYNTQASGGSLEQPAMSFDERIAAGVNAVKEIVAKIWMYLLVGIGIGSVIHGYVPENFMAGLMGKSAWWSVPVSVLLGIPMYSNAAGIIPIVQALLEKGASLGTVLAFMMSVIGLSLPELIILKKVLKIQLIITFTAIVAVGIILVGYLFNYLF